MERRDFVKEIVLGCLAVTVSPLLMGQAEDAEYSPFLKIAMNSDSPQFDFFSIDSLGKNMLAENVILHDAAWITYKLNIKKNGIKAFT